MTNEERILSYLRRISPRSVSNGEIARQTEIRPHQQVFQITRRLLDRGTIRGTRDGHEWRFWIEAGLAAPNAPLADSQPAPQERATEAVSDAYAFERLARRVMSGHYGTQLQPGRVSNIPKMFDLVSADCTVVGDAKYFSLVRGVSLPPAKFSIIAEHVWLMEKTRSAHTFLVFGNDRRVPVRWLERYGRLREGVEFFFLASGGELERLS